MIRREKLENLSQVRVAGGFGIEQALDAWSPGGESETADDLAIRIAARKKESSRAK
jgi:hypothetical protein